MRFRVRLACLFAAAQPLFCACIIGTGLGGGAPAALNPVETFTENDRPKTSSVKLDGNSFALEAPWGYERPANASREYPIVVNGCWGEGSYFTETVRRKYPAFFLDFNNFSTEEHGRLLSDLLDVVNSAYRIDMSRVYLTGFSQGGSGSFKLVRGMLSKGKLFAAIIRVAGQSESVIAAEAAEKTSLWYHIGLSDTAERVQVARDTYADLKARSINAKAHETIAVDSTAGYSRATATLTKAGIAVVKYSEYEGMGHDPGPCYKDPDLFDWLFNQSLAIR